MFTEYILTGNGQSELNTEIRFMIASAKVDNTTLVRFVFSSDPASGDDGKIKTCIVRVLRALKKEGTIEFFVTRAGFDEEITEAVFLINKYGEYIDSEKSNNCIYVKL